MDIDFLKSKSKGSANKGQDPSLDIEYSRPIASKQASKEEVKQEKKPEPAPIKKVPKLKKDSWWKKFKSNFKAKPKQRKETQPLPITPEKKYSGKPKEEETKKVFPIKKDLLQPELTPVDPDKPIVPEVKKSIEKIVLPKINIEPKKTISKAKHEDGVVTPPKISNDEIISTLKKRQIEKNRLQKSSKDTPAVLDVNLIPDDLAAKLKPATKIRGLVWVGIFSLCFLLLVYGGMLTYQSYLMNKVMETQSEIEKIEEKIVEHRNWQTEALLFNKKIENVSSILNKHIYWTAFFQALEEYTLPNVYYQNLTGDVTGTFTLTAMTNSYEAVSQQIALFKQADFVEDVQITTANATTSSIKDSEEEKVVNFNISLTVKPQVFYYSETSL